MYSIISNILKEYPNLGELTDVKENNQGNINSTFILTFRKDGEERKYLLQKINSTVFKEPYIVMHNIDLVTNHINHKFDENGDTIHKTLRVIKNKNNLSLINYTNGTGEKEYYRMYDFIEDCKSYNTLQECNDPSLIAYNVGKCYGNFHKLLDDFPAETLTDTIPNFHNTPSRFNDFLEAVENNITGRVAEIKNEIVDLITEYKKCAIIYQSLGKTIPLRVTHNDTKLNNILMSGKTDEGIAVIDLDTVMSGSYLFDIGDAIRSVCSLSFEDETNPDLIKLDVGLTKDFLSGYLDEMKDSLTAEEIKYIPLSILTLTYELSLRFLTDYINGDTYFKIKYPEHNKVRGINQLLLFKDECNKYNQIESFVKRYMKENKIKVRKLTKD